ncbi:RadC family protein [Pararhodobacter oceanensis]|uniref:RadC family protein n=1 Tax=Pararhodobacter oceanensis TaxID=2172121 RepID=UPI003A92658F
MSRAKVQIDSMSEMSLPLFLPSAPAETRAGAASAPKAPSYLRDHRKRLRSRFLEGGADAMPDYELLELLLMGAIPRRDVKPLARALLEEFNDLASVIAAPAPKLAQQEGVGPSVICALHLAGAIAARTARSRVLNRRVISSWDALLEYCHTVMSHRDVEHVRVLFLDRKNCLLTDEELGRGTVDHVPVYPREILRRALELGASALILVHNHPSGDPTPSQADIAMTERIRQGAEALSLVLHDHLIIGASTEYSFRANGLL